MSKVVLWVKLPDITSRPSKVSSTLGVNRKVRGRLCDYTKESEINTYPDTPVLIKI